MGNVKMANELTVIKTRDSSRSQSKLSARTFYRPDQLPPWFTEDSVTQNQPHLVAPKLGFSFRYAFPTNYIYQAGRKQSLISVYHMHRKRTGSLYQIAQLHDDVILPLQLESLRVLLCCANQGFCYLNHPRITKFEYEKNDNNNKMRKGFCSQLKCRHGANGLLSRHYRNKEEARRKKFDCLQKEAKEAGH